MIVDPEQVAVTILEIAEEEISPRFGKLAAHEIGTKSSPNDFVTEADLAAERQLEKALGGFYPGAVFIGEERSGEDPSLVSRLIGAEGAFWIVDPLDGTRNFVQGRAEFGTIVALVVNGEIVNGWICAIPERQMAIGEKGAGATWRGERLGPVAASDKALVGYRAVGNLAEPWKSIMVPRLRARFQTETMSCSAYAYIRLISGVRDFALYSRINPWDHAAGVLMLHEIGGRAIYLDDNTPYEPVAVQGRPMLTAGNGEAWNTVARALTGDE